MPDLNSLGWPHGLKKTKQRINIINALYESDKPVSAQELSSLLEHRGTPMWLSTIYRVLDTLVEHEAIQKAAVHESGMALYELGRLHRHYAVCVGCHRVTAIHGCPLDSFMTELSDGNFHVMGHHLQISGYCGDCYIKLVPKSSDASQV